MIPDACVCAVDVHEPDIIWLVLGHNFLHSAQMFHVLESWSSWSVENRKDGSILELMLISGWNQWLTLNGRETQSEMKKRKDQQSNFHSVCFHCTATASKFLELEIHTRKFCHFCTKKQDWSPLSWVGTALAFADSLFLWFFGGFNSEMEKTKKRAKCIWPKLKMGSVQIHSAQSNPNESNCDKHIVQLLCKQTLHETIEIATQKARHEPISSLRGIISSQRGHAHLKSVFQTKEIDTQLKRVS